MSSLVINGDTSGSITLAAPAVAGSSTITLPTTGGTMRTTTTAGTVLQVVNSVYTTSTSTSSTSFATTGHSGSITPISSTSKILVLVNGAAVWNNNVTNKNANLTVYRNGANIASDSLCNLYCNAFFTSSITIAYLDSPASTSSVTYTVYFKVESGGTITYVFQPSGVSAVIPASMTLMEIAA